MHICQPLKCFVCSLNKTPDTFDSLVWNFSRFLPLTCYKMWATADFIQLVVLLVLLCFCMLSEYHEHHLFQFQHSDTNCRRKHSRIKEMVSFPVLRVPNFIHFSQIIPDLDFTYVAFEWLWKVIPLVRRFSYIICRMSSVLPPIKREYQTCSTHTQYTVNMWS